LLITFEDKKKIVLTALMRHLLNDEG